MKCKAIHKKLIFFLEGDLPDEEMQEIKGHLTRCAECAAFAGEMKRTLAVVQLETPAQAAPYFYTRLKARMEKQEEMERLDAGFSIWEKALQPALFSVLLLAGVYTGIKIGREANTGIPAPDYAKTEVVPFLNEMKAEPLESFLME